MTQNVLRWGIIGCGQVVEKKSGPSLEQSEGSTIVAVMRRNAEKAKEYAARHKVPLATNNAAELVESPDVDIVYVATPPSSHAEYTKLAARAGKHVLVEKPMAMNAQQGREMIETCKQAGVKLFVAYYRRFHLHVQKMRELIRNGTIGTPVQAFIDKAAPLGNAPDWKETAEISGGGYFVDIVSHRIDALIYLLGSPKESFGVATSYNPEKTVEDTVSLCVHFESRAQGVVTGDFYSGRKADRFDIIGTRGSIRTDFFDGQSFELESDDKTRTFQFEKNRPPHFGLVRHIEAVLSGREENVTSGEEGLMTEFILDQSARRIL
jgi:predicted dehydrogenase